MGDVIAGPWRHPPAPDQKFTLGEEIARMTAALERLRELRRHGAVVTLRAVSDTAQK